MIKVNMVKNDNRQDYGDLSVALSNAYSTKKAVLVTLNDDLVCVFIPNNDDYTICIDNEGDIKAIKGEFVEFDDEELYNWDNCTFEVIHTEQIQIIVTRD